MIHKITTLLLPCIIILNSCSVNKKKIDSERESAFKYNYCSPTVPYQQSSALWTDMPDADLFNTPLSAHDQLVCHLLGISGAVDSLWLIRQGKIPPNENRFTLQQKATGRLLVAQSQLLAIAAELDCEGERANLAANYLDGINNSRKTNLTATSVIIGAVTTVAVVVASHKTAISIGGGLLGGALSALTIDPKGKRLAFYHERNLLRTIWLVPANNQDYPCIVWKMLHQKQFSNKGDVTLAESIRNRWLQFQFNGKITKEQDDLFFANGGLYRADDLHARAAMINQLQSTIRSLNQDLTGTITFVEGI